MISVKSDDLWAQLDKLANKATSIKAAVAYVSDDSCISFGNDDVLVVDASDASIAGGRTSAKLLKVAYRKGAKLYSCDTLHGKVIAFDHYAYIGSANISNNSREHLDEIGIITDHPAVMAGAIQIINDLIGQSVEINEKFINAICKIKVKQKSSLRKEPRNIRIKKPVSWLVSLRNDADYPGNEVKVENDNKSIDTSKNEEPAWFWMRKGSRFYDKAKLGDAVVIIEREKKDSKIPEYVYKHFTIKEITNDNNKNVKAYHYAYAEDCAIKWKQFKKLAKTVGIKNLGTGLNTTRTLSEAQSNALFELWIA